MSWQKPARIGVAIVGLISAVAVYLTMGERQASPTSRPIRREDDKAIAEFSGSTLKQFVRARTNFELEGGTDVKISLYPDGSKKVTGNPLVFVVHKGDERTVKISGHEAKISQDENSVELLGPVKLLHSDGFWLETDRATVSRVDSIAHVPGAATFGKGRMTGSGVGFSYDEKREVLLIAQQARVKTVDEAGKAVMDMAAGSGMLDRAQHLLTLDTNVHVVRNGETINTDLANGRLSVDNDVVTYVELHGNANVAGGTSIEAMNARDLALDYTEDGKTIETVKMAGNSKLAMKGEGGKPGLQIAGETVDLALAADGMLTSATARNSVRLELPAVADGPPRTITAQALDGTGEAGKGLTFTIFSGGITFVEQALPAKAAPADNKGGREIRAEKLEASMANDAVEAATFTGGDVTFEETGLKGCAARVEYQPKKDSLTLSGATKGGNPIVAEEDTAIEGESIEVALESRQMKVRREVRTYMRMPEMKRCRPATKRRPTEQGASNVPRLLKGDAPLEIRASSLDYDSRTGHAVYTGGPDRQVTLVQGETSMIGETVVIDQSKGNLSATGKALSVLVLDNKKTTGRADVIRYSDEDRKITFASAPKASSGNASLKSPESTLSAGGITVVLAPKENTLESMTALRNVQMSDATHRMTDGATLSYTAAKEEYEVKGDGTKRIVIEWKNGEQCRRSSGNLVIFYKGNDKVTVDGGQTSTAATAPSGSACTPAAR